tara:strand:+ start:183 stop:767 length:585 start_codon:yes stop_codon:yes gene_type:complete
MAALILGLAAGCSYRKPPRAYSNENLQASESLRLSLSQMTQTLGEPLPAADPKDRLGVEDLPGLSQRVFAPQSPVLAKALTRSRLTAWKDKVHTIEVTFPEGCSMRCAGLFFSTFNEWLAAPPPQQQGGAQTQTVQQDTVQFTFEWYPEKTEITRLLIQCQPLYAAAHHRPSRLPGVGQSIEVERLPRCRPLLP